MSGHPKPASPIQASLDLVPQGADQTADGPLFQVAEIVNDGEHRWAVVHCHCDPDDELDPLITYIVEIVRDAYGETDILELASELSEPEPDAAVADTFDLTLLRKAVRMGMPDPEVEVGKPDQLSNYRSESGEFLARGALAAAYSVAFPVSPQQGKTNANQPVLGFDNWGFIALRDSKYVLVLVQVKSTENTNRPPPEIDKLVKECSKVRYQPDQICRALTILAPRLKDKEHQSAVLRMLEILAQAQELGLVVAPVLVRGRTRAHLDDLTPLRDAAATLSPAIGHGITVSIEEALTKFGRTVMSRARAV